MEHRKSIRALCLLAMWTLRKHRNGIVFEKDTPSMSGVLQKIQVEGAIWAKACWKYALEAIINWLLLYFLVHDNRLLSKLELY